MSEKSKGQKLQEKLAYKKANYFETASEEERKEIMRRHENHKARCALIASAMAHILSAS